MASIIHQEREKQNEDPLPREPNKKTRTSEETGRWLLRLCYFCIKVYVNVLSNYLIIWSVDIEVSGTSFSITIENCGLEISLHFRIDIDKSFCTNNRILLILFWNRDQRIRFLVSGWSHSLWFSFRYIFQQISACQRFRFRIRSSMQNKYK